MDTIDFTPATDRMRSLIEGVADDQLGDPTPCTDYTVGDLVDHIGGLAVAFTAAAEKRPLDGGPSGDASRLEDGWRDRIGDDLTRLDRAWSRADAYHGDAAAGGVEMPAAEMAVVALNEVVVHGWDLATATGQPFDVDPDSLAILTGFAESFAAPELAEMRGDAFGEVLEVPDDASGLERLLGLLGRRA